MIRQSLCSRPILPLAALGQFAKGIKEWPVLQLKQRIRPANEPRFLEEKVASIKRLSKNNF
jgi:hypothetical protein